MASTADALYRTEVFAHQNQQAISSSATTQWADVFARRERRATRVSIPEPRRRTVRLSIDSEPIEITYTTFGAGLPKWPGPVLQSLSARWGTRPAGHIYRATPTHPQ